MERINTEILVSSLFASGFDKVDAILFVYTLGKLSIDNQDLRYFEFYDQPTSPIFKEYVDYDGITFKLKEGFTLDTEISPVEGFTWPLGKALNTSKSLINYLNEFDFSEIVLKKANLYDIKNVDEIDDRFSNREVEILKQMNFNNNAILNLKK